MQASHLQGQDAPVSQVIGHMYQLFNSDCYDPHTILGLHDTPEGRVIRLWRPDALEAFIELRGEIRGLPRIAAAGLFELTVSADTTLRDYRVYHTDGTLGYDPYCFLPTFGEIDCYLFAKGVHYELYRAMGARVARHQDVNGVKFSVWAPSAKRLSVVGDFNRWDGRVNPMRSLGESGVWELFIPDLPTGSRYKFEIKTQTGDILLKSDPYALASELRPATASVVADLSLHTWQDGDWMTQRLAKKDTPQPLSIYEVHLGSWRRGDNNAFLNYREIAHQLADYCTEHGFTHVELLPVAEHPLDESWGYQVTGFYSVTSRFGSLQDFQYFVDYLHRHNIGIIVDWVPGHFPRDAFALANFDGTHLYEHADPRQGFHPHWGTNIFNFGRHEVSCFLLANALFWLEALHIDGLRVDAVASMLYLDYGREAGEWIPNQYGGNENFAAIEFLKHMNSVVHQRCPGTLTIAEESTAFPKVSHPVVNGGLGFSLKWSMGWMNDTLRYFSKDAFYRHYHHHDLTFGLLYAFTERFALVFSHDEVVHGKGSLLAKMPGDYWQKFANLRLLLSYQLCQPGKKLLFMGAELGQWNEWNCVQPLDWLLLQFPVHQGIRAMVKAINHTYRAHSALWYDDFTPQGFAWVDFSDARNSVISYLRKSPQETILCVHNFTPTYFGEYDIALANVATAQEILNTDDQAYGGSGKSGSPIHIITNANNQATHLRLSLAPLATQLLHITFQKTHDKI